MKQAHTKRKQQALQTKDKILTCALRLFAEKGFENVSMEMIAEESQTSIGAIYHHFPSKDAIPAQMLGILDEQYGEFFQKLMTEQAYSHLSPLEKLEEYFVFVQERSSQMSTLNYAYIHDLKNRQATTVGVRPERELYKNYQVLIQQCKDAGQLPDQPSNEEIIQILTQISRGLLVDWLLQDSNFDILPQARTLIHFFLSGLCHSTPESAASVTDHTAAPVSKSSLGQRL